MNYLKLFGIAAFAIGTILYLASSDDHVVVVGDQKYDLGEYVKISVNISSDVKVQAGEDYSLNVKAHENDLKNIRIYVKGHTLVIKKKPYDRRWKGDRPEITITLPRLEKFTLNGTSDVEIQDIHGRFFMVAMNGSGTINFEGSSEELKAVINGSGTMSSTSYDARESRVDINGSGSVELAGKCKTLAVEINGSGRFSGKDYRCEDVEVNSVGSGDIEVNASAVVEVDVTGSGDVNVYGKPKQVKDRSRKKNHVTIH